MSFRTGIQVALLLMVSSVSSPARAWAETNAPIPIAAFFGNPTISQPKLSPSGEHLAFVFSKDDYQRVFVRPVVGSETVGLAEFPMSAVRLRWLAWANSGRLLLSGVAPDPRATGVQPLVSRLYAVNRDRPQLKWLGERWPQRGPDWPSQQLRFEDEVIDLLPGDRDHVLVSHLEYGNREPSLSKMNVYSGRLRLLRAATAGVERWHVDRRGDVRAAEGFGVTRDGKSYSLLARSDAGRKLAPIATSPDRAVAGYRFAGFHEEPGLLYVLADREGRDALYEFDIEAGALGALVFAHPEVDVTAAHYSDVWSKVVGAEYLVDEPRIDFFDDAARKEQKMIDRSLRASRAGDSTNRVVSASRDGQLAIIEVSSHVQPPVYYAFDRSRREINFIFEQRPEIPGKQLAEVEKIRFATRDGVEIPGYLTRPRNVASAKLPLIVLPHAGPASRDARVFDPVVQFFASRGFAVLQVNARGSGGYGRAFQAAGSRRLGQAMRDDQSDAVRWTIEQGIADADRIGIFGVGYAGYSALMGLVTEPGLYRAGASYAAASELEWLARDNPDRLRQMQLRDDGGGDASSEQLRQVSPLRRVEEIRAPLLLGHGALDPQVLVKHSRELAHALEAAGKVVEYVEYEGEVHGLALASSRVDFFARTLKFFEAQLAPRRPAPEPPEAGS